MNLDRSWRRPVATFVGPQDGREIPWGNGGGASRELILRTRADTPDRLLWRMSTTRILTSCPFSAYAGYKRTITLLSGGAFTLDFFGEAPAHTVARFEPFDFNGGWKTHCNLPGDIAVVLNVMADESVIYSRTTLTPGPSASRYRLETDAVLLYGLEGTTRLAAPFDLPAAEMKAGDMMAIERAQGEDLEMAGNTNDARVLFFFLLSPPRAVGAVSRLPGTCREDRPAAATGCRPARSCPSR